VEPLVKECLHCKSVKGLDEFDRSKDGAAGRASRCKVCRRAYNRAAYERSRDGLPGLRPPRPQGQPKACRDCGEVKAPDAFFRSARAADGRGSYCKPCHGLRVKASKDKKGGSRDYHLRLRYGITAAEVDTMKEAQGGLCALCRERPAQHVDHDHLTGKVRGVLCSCCNQGLGNVRDRADVMRAAIGYLETHSWQKRRIAPGVYALHPPRN
jgi:hypothetical protein